MEDLLKSGDFVSCTWEMVRQGRLGSKSWDSRENPEIQNLETPAKIRRVDMYDKRLFNLPTRANFQEKYKYKRLPLASCINGATRNAQLLPTLNTIGAYLDVRADVAIQKIGK